MLNISSFKKNSFDFCLRLLEETGVAAVQGSFFGKSTEGWIRLSFAVSEESLAEGIKGIGGFIHK